jgi:hypothetical protein
MAEEEIGRAEKHVKFCPMVDDDDDDDDVYLRLQHGEGFRNFVYMSYIKHINAACKA